MIPFPHSAIANLSRDPLREWAARRHRELHPTPGPRLIFWEGPRTGLCFELAALGQRQAPLWTLVHGQIAPGGYHHHAWLELGARGAYDPVLDWFFTIAEYGERFKPLMVRRYTYDEALHHMRASGTYGPWPFTRDLRDEAPQPEDCSRATR